MRRIKRRSHIARHSRSNNVSLVIVTENVVFRIYNSCGNRVTLSQAKGLAVEITKHFGEEISLQQQGSINDQIKIPDGGRGSGRSIKAKNLRLNIQSLLLAAAEGFPNMASITTAP